MRSRYLGSATAAYPAAVQSRCHSLSTHLGDISRQVSLRNVRREAIDKIKKLQKDGLSEDQSKEAQVRISAKSRVDLGQISGRPELTSTTE